jgi:Cyanophycin synthase-like N-terminal domain
VPPADPATEIRMTALQALRGANYWSARPVTRMDLAVGAYEDISSAQAPGFTEALRAALPGLVEHRCSIGERGGFITRLRRGTYAPHIIEHVALELQCMIGHDVGYGKTRGGDVPGEYTVVFEHLHSGVGLRAAALALEIVQHAFVGTLDSIDYALTELKSIAESPDAPPLWQHVLCGITGGGPRHETRDELLRLGVNGERVIVDVAPGYILQAGLPYSRSEFAVILDAEPTDVPERYQDPERARQLVSVLADAVWRGGIVIAPAKEWEVQDRAREVGCRVAVFAIDDDLTARDKKVAHSAASVENGRIVVECCGTTTDAGPLRDDAPAAAQVAAALAMFTIQELKPNLLVGAASPGVGTRDSG